MPTRRILRGFPTCIALLAVIGSGQAALQGDAEQAIRTLARQIPGEESIHSCLIPET